MRAHVKNLGLESTVIKEINYDSKTYKEKDSNS